MRFLFVHQNFPGQFRHVAKALASNKQHKVVALAEHRNIYARDALHPEIECYAYKVHRGNGSAPHHYIRDLEGHVRRGQSVARALIRMKESGFYPDVIVVHPGWGEAMFIKDIFPESRQVHYFEYYYHGDNSGDFGFDPDFPASLDDSLRVRVKNTTQLLSLVACDDGLSPTMWQKSRYPEEFHRKICVIHDGIDTRTAKPDPLAFIRIDGLLLNSQSEVVTYVARNLEPYRGFHHFMRAIPGIQRTRPGAHIVIVGGDDVSYGHALPSGDSYREHYVRLLGSSVDWSRVHFLGKISYIDYLHVLQISSCHVYLTYPFVLSWSMLESMAVGCALVASATKPVEEVVEHGKNGLLVDFFDIAALAETICRVLAEPERFAAMRQRARQTMIERYDLYDHCLPRLIDFLTG